MEFCVRVHYIVDVSYRYREMKRVLEQNLANMAKAIHAAATDPSVVTVMKGNKKDARGK